MNFNKTSERMRVIKKIEKERRVLMVQLIHATGYSMICLLQVAQDNMATSYSLQLAQLLAKGISDNCPHLGLGVRAGGVAQCGDLVAAMG